MKHGLLRSFALVTAASFALGSASALAQATTANGPYYASPSWDQTLPVATRFIVLSNFNSEAVLDRETGLVWERTPNASTFTHSDANAYCQQLKPGGRMGWRMPQTADLFSLLDPSQINGGPVAALPNGHPFAIGAGIVFHLNDRVAPPFNDNQHLLVLFLNGAFTIGVDTAFASARVWCVRGPGGSPTPW